jgi:hypothetical protein
MNYTMQGIPAQLVDHFWPFAEPYIKRALDHTSGEFVAGDFKQLCMDRTIQLWLVNSGERIVGAITTEIVQYPNKKHCRVITIAGSGFAEWVNLADTTLCTWAASQQCDAMETYVRRGFVPKLQPIGYKQKHVVMVKEL